MKERRRKPRIPEEDKITITAISGEENIPQKKFNYHLSKNISESGIGIYSNTFLPVDTQIRIEVKLKDSPKKIIAFAKVIWIKRFSTNDFCEAGLEFFNTSNAVMQQLKDYISLKL
jgi:c-di-GMP-binding flagellar brake protein YcgR